MSALATKNSFLAKELREFKMFRSWFASARVPGYGTASRLCWIRASRVDCATTAWQTSPVQRVQEGRVEIREQDTFSRKMVRHIKPRGYLFLGNSEQIPWLHDMLDPSNQTMDRLRVAA